MSASPDWDRRFREDLAADAAVERALLVKECVIIALIVLLAALREGLW
jgi:hypothetical protein